MSQEEERKKKEEGRNIQDTPATMTFVEADSILFLNSCSFTKNSVDQERLLPSSSGGMVVGVIVVGLSVLTHTMRGLLLLLLLLLLLVFFFSFSISSSTLGNILKRPKSSLPCLCEDEEEKEEEEEEKEKKRIKKR